MSPSSPTYRTVKTPTERLSRYAIRTAAWSAAWPGGVEATGIKMFVNETEPSYEETNPAAPFGMKRVICRDSSATGTATDLLSHGRQPLL